MKSTALIFWLILALAATACYAGWKVYHRENSASLAALATAGFPITPPGQAEVSEHNIPAAGGKTVPSFQLVDQNDKKFNSKTLLGKVWVGSYFFASCPGPCYKLNQALAGLQADDALDAVRFVSISCDPTNDQPEVLHEYAARFGADAHRWEFLTGDEDKIIKIGQASFGIPVALKTHSELAVIFDRKSRIRGYFNLVDPGEVNLLERRLRTLLAEKETEAAPAAK